MLSKPIVIISGINTAQSDPGPFLPAVAQTASYSRSVSQAVAAARLGASVSAVGRVTDDDLGHRVVAELKTEGVDCTWLRICAAGEPQLQTVDVELAEDAFSRVAVCVLNNELPGEILEHTIGLCRRHGVETLLNIGSLAEGEMPASAFQVDAVCCGEHEAAQLTGLSVVKNIRVAAACLAKRGCRSVVLRLGQHGSYVLAPEGESAVPGFAVPILDTTAAAAAFTAALAVARCWDWKLGEAIRLANAAGALAGSRMDAPDSMPTLAEVEALLASS